MNSYEKFHLKEVINASGKMTILGVSKVSEAVLAAQRFGGEHFFEMSELSVQTGAFLANLLKVEDAQIVSSASAGIAQSVAALIGKGSLYHAYHPYTEKIVLVKNVCCLELNQDALHIWFVYSLFSFQRSTLPRSNFYIITNFRLNVKNFF